MGSTMKRSDINVIIRDADAFIRSRGFYLPPFAYWTPEDWCTKGEEVREIVENHLGWDITDFGLGDYGKYGLFLFTLRNGNPANLITMRGKIYAEKLLIVAENQFTPMHFHWSKMEDIINRGGGNLLIRVSNATPDGQLASSNVTVSLDSVAKVVPAGTQISLAPGESSEHSSGTVPRVHGTRRAGIGRRGFHGQRRRHRQPFPEPCRPLPGHPGGRAAASSAMYRLQQVLSSQRVTPGFSLATQGGSGA